MVDRIFRQQHFAFCCWNKHWQIKARVQAVEFFLADACQTSGLGSVNRGGDIQSLDTVKLLDLFNTNVIAGMMMTGLAVPHLELSQGAVIFIGSSHTRRAFPGASPYAATKASLEGLTKVLAAELGPKNIRVNCVIPGAVYTEINQRAGLFDDEAAKKRLHGMADLHVLGRIGTALEIAEAMDYLIRAEWTTGAVLDVDGGLGLGTSRN